MNTPDDRQRRLEEVMGRVLSEQPLRRAPPGLEARVLAAIGGRAQRTWWQASFRHWPRAAQLTFLAASIAFAGAALRALLWLTQPFEAAARAFDLPTELTLLHTTATALFLVLRSMPPLWLWSGIAVLALLYAALVGIGATAYRTLHLAR